MGAPNVSMLVPTSHPDWTPNQPAVLQPTELNHKSNAISHLPRVVSTTAWNDR